jgi:hypothetical protein
VSPVARIGIGGDDRPEAASRRGPEIPPASASRGMGTGTDVVQRPFARNHKPQSYFSPRDTQSQLVQRPAAVLTAGRSRPPSPIGQQPAAQLRTERAPRAARPAKLVSNLLTNSDRTPVLAAGDAPSNINDTVPLTATIRSFRMVRTEGPRRPPQTSEQVAGSRFASVATSKAGSQLGRRRDCRPRQLIVVDQFCRSSPAVSVLVSLPDHRRGSNAARPTCVGKL